MTVIEVDIAASDHRRDSLGNDLDDGAVDTQRMRFVETIEKRIVLLNVISGELG